MPKKGAPWKRRRSECLAPSGNTRVILACFLDPYLARWKLMEDPHLGLLRLHYIKGTGPPSLPIIFPILAISYPRPGLLLLDHPKQLGTLAPCNDQSLYLDSMSPIHSRRGRY
jgi:hypothetical protein